MPPSTPPPQPPPAGWYPDRDGTGLRWWDGERWTEHVSSAQAASESQPPPEAPPVGESRRPSGEDGEARKRSNAFFLAAAAVVVLVGVAIVVLTAPGGDSRAAYTECQRDVQPVLSAMQSLGSHLDVGVIQSNYSAEVGDVQSTYDRLTAKHPAAACQPAVRALGEAMEDYALASSEWNECIFSEEEECAEGSVQELWSNAGRSIATARQRLSSLTGGADAVAAAESEAAQVAADAMAKVQAHSAQVAIETYATENQGSYEGATPAKLRGIEPSLPSGLEVAEAGFDYYSISVISKDGNWFRINHKVNGEVDFKCGERGNGGCPGSGRWA